MLSNPNPASSLHARQRQHRRQSSTPSAFEGVKMPPTLPNASQREAASHRRGISLDNRRQQTAWQDYKVGLSTNNPGLAPNPQHHVLREAQPQQHMQACPGPQQHQHHQQHHHQQHHHHYAASMAPMEGGNYLISPHETPQAPRFDPSSCFDTSAIPFNPYGAHLNLMMQKNQESYASNMAEAKEFDLYTNDGALSTPTFISFPDSPSAQGWPSEEASRRSSRRISNGIMDRVSKFENLGMEELHQRPMTPPNQNGNNCFPPTPMETPHDRLSKQESRPDRFQDGFDESMEETIKPLRSRSNPHAAQSIFQEMRQQAERCSAVPSPPRSSTLPTTKTFGGMQMQAPDYMNMKTLRNEFAKMEGGYDGLQYETDALHSDPSHRSTPDAQHMGQFLSGFNDHPRRTPPHRRTESVASTASIASIASIASAASIASINIEETKTETGVTMEEISQYIRSPETTDGKWACLFDDCGKKFGRKENIKSHVQTHLNDRQYQCPTCKKCFVRQHDLKRHAKIHTGIKPYPCECGNSFARHDALTRHRQRGMCIGAFDGIVRKVVKRGRPRKNRPDMEARMDKSARQRKKNMSISSTSSVSGYSDSSAANSPDDDYHMLDDVVDMGGGGSQGSSAPMPAAAPMMAAPMLTDAVVTASPSAVSAHLYVSPEAAMETTLSDPATPAKSVASHYTTPPELSQSSSPPAARFFDAEGPAVSTDTDGMAAMAEGEAIPLGMGGQDAEDLLLQFTNDDGLVQLDRDSGMLMMSKFDEEFDNVGMFSSDDMFFGSA